MSATEDPRDAARRIVAEVLAAHENHLPDDADVEVYEFIDVSGVDTPAAPAVVDDAAPVTPVDDQDAITGDEDSPQGRARRIVADVLAAEAARVAAASPPVADAPPSAASPSAVDAPSAADAPPAAADAPSAAASPSAGDVLPAAEPTIQSSFDASETREIRTPEDHADEAPEHDAPSDGDSARLEALLFADVPEPAGEASDRGSEAAEVERVAPSEVTLAPPWDDSPPRPEAAAIEEARTGEETGAEPLPTTEASSAPSTGDGAALLAEASSAPSPDIPSAAAPQESSAPTPEGPSAAVPHDRSVASPDEWSAPSVEDRDLAPGQDPDEVPETTHRTGRWLLTTVAGALALAWLLPMAVAALRDLVALS